MIGLLRTPVVLAALLLAAHFLRRGQALPMLASLALLALVFVRREWARRTIQIALVLGTLEWARTLAAFAAERRAAGEPWVRMALILGAVIAITLGGAVALEARSLRRRFTPAVRRDAGANVRF